MKAIIRTPLRMWFIPRCL